MIELVIAAALQASARPADPCHMAGTAETPRAGCPSWRFVRGNDQGRGYLDPASVRREGTRVEIMTRTVAYRPIAGGVRSFTVLLRLDCATRTALPVLFVGYDAEGVQVFERRDEDRAIDPTPGSAFAAMMDEYCGAATGA